MLILALDTLLGPTAKVSRIYALLLIVFMGLVTLELVNYQQVALNWRAIGRGEIWRMMLCFLWTGPVSIHSCWECFMLYTYMSKLEEEAYHRRTADFVWILMNSIAVLLTIHCVMSHYVVLERTMASDLFLLLTYLWGRKNPQSRTHILFFSIPAGYLAWLHAGLQFAISSNQSFFVSFLGMLAGHIVFFFVEYIPSMPTTRGIYVFGKTPQFLKQILPDDDEVAPPRPEDDDMWEDAGQLLR